MKKNTKFKPGESVEDFLGAGIALGHGGRDVFTTNVGSLAASQLDDAGALALVHYLTGNVGEARTRSNRFPTASLSTGAHVSRGIDEHMTGLACKPVGAPMHTTANNDAVNLKPVTNNSTNVRQSQLQNQIDLKSSIGSEGPTYSEQVPQLLDYHSNELHLGSRLTRFMNTKS